MNRRGFLGAIAGAIAGATLDPERALWVPGQRVYSIPSIVEPPWICPDLLTAETLKAIEDSLVFHRNAFLIRFESEFFGNPLRIGDTLNIRRPARFRARVG